MNRKNQVRRAARGRGFTIIEIIVVVVIIGVLAAVVAPRLLSRVGQAKQSVAASNASAIANAVKQYQIDNDGKLPSGASLESLLMGGQTKYLDNTDMLMDPWGEQFKLVMPGQKNVDFDIVSYGADKKPGGTGDDADVIKP